MYTVLVRPEFEQPDREATVWRYMDLARFISILEDSALYFTQARLMADKWEGASGGSRTGEDLEARQHWRDIGRQSIYLNCWNVSEFESAAMWDIYQREGRGVAIRSTWGHLTDSITSTWDINGGKVRYADIAKVEVADGNIYTPFMHKRFSFAHENEARLLLWDIEEGGPMNDELEGNIISMPTNGMFHHPGWKVEVDPKTLVDAVYVAPDLPDWFGELVRKIVARYGYDFQVVQSDLNTAPIV
jgi:hypothetical protein